MARPTATIHHLPAWWMDDFQYPCGAYMVTAKDVEESIDRDKVTCDRCLSRTWPGSDATNPYRYGVAS